MSRLTKVHGIRVEIPYKIFAFIESACDRYPHIPRRERFSYVIFGALGVLYDIAALHSLGYVVISETAELMEVHKYETSLFVRSVLDSHDGAHFEFAGDDVTYATILAIGDLLRIKEPSEVIKVAVSFFAELATALLSGKRLFIGRGISLFSPDNFYMPEPLEPFRYKTFQ